jgi:transposase
MSKKSRTLYTSEFKLSAIKLATESDQPMAQTARELGINVNTMHNWVRKPLKTQDINMVRNECHYEEVKLLRKELAIVKQERDLLKKAAAYFAKESQ